MSSFFSKLVATWPTERALATASVVGLVALSFMVGGIVFPVPILLVAGMSVAHLLGGVALILYLLSVAAVHRQEAPVESTTHAGSGKPERT